ncbi:hypothetical protein HAX54_020817 [Datura stramonium]|uniref:Uncharacterized protein n=1 Tax=Datura stramonium TaxID=4076 RepID=A0ABS8S2Y4_DATST|nr:hypothetical protein [Datura stramonium]
MAGKRGRSRKKDESPEIKSPEGGGCSQVFQQQETMASTGRGKVTRVKLEPKQGAVTSLQSTLPGFALSDTSPSHHRYQTRNYLKAVIGQCKFMTTTPRSPVRHVKVLYPSCASGDFPSHLITGISHETKVKVDDSVHAELKHQSTLTNYGALGVVNKADAVFTANATEPETRSGQSGAHPAKSMSLNLTRIAALMNDSSSDADEVGSRPGCLSVIVDGYRVKEEAIPVLQKIFLKYGDIAMNSSFSSVTFSSSLLEFVCDIYKKLEETDFLSITPKEIQSMLAEVRDLEAAKIDVGWLSRRLNDISQAKQLLQDSCKLKEAKTRNLVVMETNKKELGELKEELAACIATCRVLQERIRKKEDEFGIARSENEIIMQNFADLKAKVNSFLKKSLVHDLL